MSLGDLLKKYGKPDTKGWFGENNIRIPAELQPYLDIQEGKLVEVSPIPEDLQNMAEMVRQAWDKAHFLSDLTEYSTTEGGCEGCLFDLGDLKYCLIYLEEAGKEKPQSCKHRKTFKEGVISGE